MAAGVNISKAVAYAVLVPTPGVNVFKANAYSVLSIFSGVDITKAISYAVLDAANTNPPVWPSFSMPAGYVGIAYSATWDLTPAASPTTYTVVSGSLPPGLALNNLTGDQGSITGTPTTAGTYPFTLRATNAYGTADQAFSITVSTISGGGGGSYTFLC